MDVHMFWLFLMLWSCEVGSLKLNWCETLEKKRLKKDHESEKKSEEK